MVDTFKSHTFLVSDVDSTTSPLAEIPYQEAIESFIDGPVEACSKSCPRLIDNVVSHPLIAALHGAFTRHHPLILSPDIIWLTITQGVAIHINQNAEQLRHSFVSHDERLKIIVRRDDFIKGSPDNPWPEVFSTFSERISDHIGRWHPLIVSDFSTTGLVERAASEIVLLDSMQAYFEYEVATFCGIPTITLEGSVEDWKNMVSRVKCFSELGLDWWVGSLIGVLNQFVEASAGHADQHFWESIYKFEGPEGSGSPDVSGWISILFPYLLEGYSVKQYRKHSQPWSKIPTREAFPNTTAKAPFKWSIGLGEKDVKHYDMEFIGGLLGVSQKKDTFALRPEIGWAVRESPPLEKKMGESKAPVWMSAEDPELLL